MGIDLLSQDRNALGLRFASDYNYGISFKHRFKKSATIEGIAHFVTNDAVIITGLYERNNSLSSGGGLQWFYGGGAYVGFDHLNRAGIAGILGLCYQFKDIPIDISIDWLPRLQIVDDVHPYFNSLGLSVRFTF